MRRDRRRLWTWAVSALALFAILAACASLAFRFAIGEVPEYRLKAQARLSEELGHPVRIETLALTWAGLRPTLDFGGVSIFAGEAEVTANAQPLLHAQRLRLGFGLTRLLRGNLMPVRADLAGLALEADVDRTGRWHLHGVDALRATPDAGSDPGAALDRLQQLLRVRLLDCTLDVHDATLHGEVLRYRLVRADLRHHGRQFDVEAVIEPPPGLSGAVELHGAVAGDLKDPASFDGRWLLAARNLRGWPWLTRALPADVSLQLEGAQLTLDGRIEAGRITEIEVAAQAQRVAALQNGRVLAQVRHFELHAGAQPTSDCWQARLENLSVEGARGPWSAGQGDYRCTQEINGLGFEARVEHLRLDDLAPWLSLYRALPPAAARLRDLDGDLQSVSVVLAPPDADDRGEPRNYYQLKARLDRVGLSGSETQTTLAGLSGDLVADTEGGRLHPDGTPPTLHLPQLFSAPLKPDSLSADLSWQHLPDGWHLDAPALEAQLAGAKAAGALSLRFPAVADASREIDLALKFSAPDATALKPWIPSDWGVHTREWLDRAIVRGRVTSGTLELKGKLADFPFTERPGGRWALDLDVADGRLEYADGWPAADPVEAALSFRGHGMAIRIKRGALAGVPVDSLKADIADFREAQLVIDGGLHADAAKLYEIVRASPIHARLSGLLDHTQAKGPAQLALHLELPLKTEPLEVRERGSVTVHGAELTVRGLEQPVRQVEGSVAFDGPKLGAEGLTGELYEVPLQARIAPAPGVPEGVLEVHAPVTMDRGDGLAAAFVPTWVRAQLDGRAELLARLPFGGAEAGHLSIESDLRGVASRLPLPLGKTAEAALPLKVALSGEPLHLGIEIGEVMRLGLRFAGSEGAESVHGVEAQFGNGAVPRAEAEGIVVRGTPEVLEVGPWVQTLLGIRDSTGPEAVSASAPSGTAADSKLKSASRSLPFVSADLKPGHLLLAGGSLSGPMLHAEPAAGGGYHVTLDGASAQGMIDWLPQNGGRLIARLDHLVFDPVPVETPATTAAAQAPEAAVGKPVATDTDRPFEPTQAPTFDVRCERLALGEFPLGRLTFGTSRIADGQQLDALRLEGGKLDLDAHGGWRRSGNRSSADVTFTAHSPDIGPVLGAFGYAQTLDAKQARFSGDLAWPRDPDGLELADAVGRVEIKLDNGVIKTVEPGPGRVLGLLNLYALPRRLLFDFRDVVSKGLAFDSIHGGFSLANGQAYTSDLEISAPSAKMRMRGRIGLVAHDYDERVTVEPDVTTGVTVGAGIAAGPVGALIALVAQEVLGKPFNKLTRFTYHVVGPWENPQVKHGSDGASPPDAPAPPAASGPADEAAPPASP